MVIDEGYIIPDRTIDPVYAVRPAGSSTQREDRKKEQQQPPPPVQKKVRDYFHPLSKAVDASNLRLAERHLPYRFKVYKRWGEVFLDLFILDDQGNVKEKQHRNISQSDFNRIIDDVVSVEGMFFDGTA